MNRSGSKLTKGKYERIATTGRILFTNANGVFIRL